MSFRPLVLVSGLTVGDYLLWNWSLNSHHDVLALVSGLTLPPLGAATAWLLVIAVMRLIARNTRLPARAAERRTTGRWPPAPSSGPGHRSSALTARARPVRGDVHGIVLAQARRLRAGASPR